MAALSTIITDILNSGYLRIARTYCRTRRLLLVHRSMPESRWGVL